MRRIVLAAVAFFGCATSFARADLILGEPIRVVLTEAELDGSGGGYMSRGARRNGFGRFDGSATSTIDRGELGFAQGSGVISSNFDSRELTTDISVSSDARMGDAFTGAIAIAGGVTVVPFTVAWPQWYRMSAAMEWHNPNAFCQVLLETDGRDDDIFRLQSDGADGLSSGYTDILLEPGYRYTLRHMTVTDVGLEQPFTTDVCSAWTEYRFKPVPTAPTALAIVLLGSSCLRRRRDSLPA